MEVLVSKASPIASLEPVWFGFSERSVDVDLSSVCVIPSPLPHAREEKVRLPLRVLKIGSVWRHS